MELILWRHAEAVDGVPDHERQLTDKGVRQAKKMAAFLRSRLPDNTHILVSPAVRAQQTARALTGEFDTEPALAPGATPRDVLKSSGWPTSEGGVLIVGHQPYLGETVALLLADSQMTFSIKKSAVWWLSCRERSGDFQTVLRLVISPEFL
jgi:phosphohistidine phosphatase